MPVAAHQGVQNSSIATETNAPEHGRPFLQPAETRMIYVVGGDDRSLEWAALALFRAGHIPVLGQWFWPLASNDTVHEAEMAVYGDPVGERLLLRCDAMLRIDGTASDADELVSIARARGMRIYNTLDEAIAG
jgi:hypothetical protein